MSFIFLNPYFVAINVLAVKQSPFLPYLPMFLDTSYPSSVLFSIFTASSALSAFFNAFRPFPVNFPPATNHPANGITAAADNAAFT